MKKLIILNLSIITICSESLFRVGFSFYPVIIIFLEIISTLLLFISRWTPVDVKPQKTFMWWYHKFMCELWYEFRGSGKMYYKHLNIMIAFYDINLYGRKHFESKDVIDRFKKRYNHFLKRL